MLQIPLSCLGQPGYVLPLRYVLGEMGHTELLKDVRLSPSHLLPAQIPDNKALEGLAGGLLEAWRIYDRPQAAILFIIEDITYNICDQK